MNRNAFLNRVDHTLTEIQKAGLWKHERVLVSPQGTVVRIGDKHVLNLCSNDYLGLANNPRVKKAACEGIVKYGYGTASVRFICGSHTPAVKLERKLSEFLGKEDTLIFSSCFDANAFFEVLFGRDDALVSDKLVHASLIDGMRLCKGTRKFIFKNNDMADLRAQLTAARAAVPGVLVVVVDGVFSMDGVVANLREITSIAEEFGAVLVVDDSHAHGVLGMHGKGSAEHAGRGMMEKVTLITGTFGKALGGGSGGFISGPAQVITLLRQRARTSLFSNSLPPGACCATLKALEMSTPALRMTLHDNAVYFRAALLRAGFTLAGRDHPIIPIMLLDAALASKFAELLFSKHDIFVVAFSYPVVPKGQARIRVQMSAAHTRKQLDRAIAAFTAVGHELGVLRAQSKL